MSLSFFTVFSYAIVDFNRKLPHLLPADVTIVVCIHRFKMLSKLAMIRLIALIPHEEAKYAFLEASCFLSLLQA